MFLKITLHFPITAIFTTFRVLELVIGTSDSERVGLSVRCQFHQHFSRAFFIRIWRFGSFSSYVLALAKNSYEKCARKMLMKLTLGGWHDCLLLKFRCQFHQRFLHAFFIWKVLFCQNKTKKSCQKDFCTKNTRVKSWWN